MKWVGISGSWRWLAPSLEDDVRREVRVALERGDGIVTGGALGVDYIATEVALAFGAGAEQLKVILPMPLAVYERHYRKRAAEGVITMGQAEELTAQMHRVADVGAFVEMGARTADREAYYARNTEVVRLSDELLAFQINGSAGTQDTIDKARAAGKPVRVHRYRVD